MLGKKKDGKAPIIYLFNGDKLTDKIKMLIDDTACVCVFFPFILDIRFVGHTSRMSHTGGRSHRRKVTQDFSSTFLLRCVP